jgi:hypothetical protein
MTKIAIPPDLAGMFAACEDAYEQAAREGYAEGTDVIAAVTALKSAWRDLHVRRFCLPKMLARGPPHSTAPYPFQLVPACADNREHYGGGAGRA